MHQDDVKGICSLCGQEYWHSHACSTVPAVPSKEELRKLADYVDTVHGPNGVNAWAEKHLPVSPMSEECDSIQDCGSLTKDVNRVEVINHTRDGEGREYVWWPKEGTYDVRIAIQDNGRTLKVFIRNHLSAEETEK